MTADFSMKAHDRLPSISAILGQKSAAGVDQAVDLTTAVSVKFIMKNKETGTVKVNAAATMVAPLNSGVVRYDWLATDTDTPGSYQGEWEVTWPSSKKQTFPTATYHSIDILADLDNA